MLRLLCFLLLLGTGCQRYWVCDEPEGSETTQLPQRLSETGLYGNIVTGELASGVLSYRPQFELWSDGAEKQRWIWLPPGRPIDNSNPNEWEFPEGTKVWKQFALGGTRLETRLLEKVGPNDADWRSLAYVWQPDDADAFAAPLGAIDTRNTDHDVPAAGECRACHGGRRSFVLGFSEIQLAPSAVMGDVDLSGLSEQGLLTDPPLSPPVVPGNAVERAALGYLHANCSHCHNSTRPEHGGARCFNPESQIDFSLPAAKVDGVEATPTYRTVVGDAVKRGDAGDSKLLKLMSSRGMFRQMPPLATEKVDTRAVADLRLWIEEL